MIGSQKVRLSRVLVANCATHSLRYKLLASLAAPGLSLAKLPTGDCCLRPNFPHARTNHRQTHRALIAKSHLAPKFVTTISSKVQPGQFRPHADKQSRWSVQSTKRYKEVLSDPANPTDRCPTVVLRVDGTAEARLCGPISSWGRKGNCSNIHQDES
jgi:hypothetical protein